MKFTFETDDITEAQLILAAISSAARLTGSVGSAGETESEEPEFVPTPPPIGCGHSFGVGLDEPELNEAKSVANPTDLDKNGLPWDERIHSSNRQKTETGVWRRRRGVSDLTVAHVEADLRRQGFGVLAPSVPLPPVSAFAPVPPQPPLPPVSAPTAVPSGPVATFDEVTGYVGTLFARNPQRDPNEVFTILQRVGGTTNLMDLKGAEPSVLGVLLAELKELP